MAAGEPQTFRIPLVLLAAANLAIFSFCKVGRPQCAGFLNPPLKQTKCTSAQLP
jgi:hypothetical protein